MSAARKWWIAGAAVAAAWLWNARASTAPARVALVRPETASASAKQALNLIQGELSGDGFDVVLIDPPDTSQGSPAGTVDGQALASIEVTVDEDGRGAELRVVDRLTNKTVTRRTTVDATETAQIARVLAVRAVELLRASMVELLMEEPAKPVAPAQKDQTRRALKWVARALDRERRATWGFDAGVAGLAGFGGVPPALLGVFRVRAAVHRSLELRATFAGLGTEPLVSSALGSARISQEVGLLEGVYLPWPEAFVHPVLSLGVGAMYFSGAGQAVWPYVGEQSSARGFVADAGTGVVLRLDRSFDVSLEVHAFLTEPYPTTQFLDQSGPGLSQPSLLGTLTVVGWP